MRTLLFLLLPIFICAQIATPRFRYVSYTGDGGDFERIVDTEIGQEITVALGTPLITGLGYDDPGLIYLWVRALDTLSLTHGGTGADKDSCSFGFVLGGIAPGHDGITTKGIKRVSGDSVIVGKWLNQLDTTYALWVISDPDTQVVTQGFYLGDGSATQTVTMTVGDSIYGLIVTPERSVASFRNTAYWSYGSPATQYLGERGADISNVVNNSFDATADMQASGNWHIYFGATKSSLYTETFLYTGNATNPRTHYYNRSGFQGFLVFGLAMQAASAVTGVFASGALDGAGWVFASSTSADYTASSSDVYTSLDSLVVGGWLNTNTLPIKVFVVGDTTFLDPLTISTSSNSVRQPCEGNTTILNKENIQRQDKYK